MSIAIVAHSRELAKKEEGGYDGESKIMSIEQGKESSEVTVQHTEQPQLVIKKPPDHRRRGSFVSVEPSESHGVNVEEVLEYIQQTPKKHVRRGRSKPNRTHRPAKPWLR